MKQAVAENGVEGVLRSAGEGAFMVEEYAVAELATALGLSEHAGRAYVGQAVELRERLPRCWAQVMAGALPAWKARRIAERTIPLGAATADAVDASLAPFAGKLSVGRIDRAVDAAILRHEPDLAAERDAAAAEKRGVWFEDRLDGTTDLTGLLDTPDACALDHALNTMATTLGELGDGDRRDVRRARALGVLADPQYALDLARTAEQQAQQQAQERAGEGAAGIEGASPGPAHPAGPHPPPPPAPRRPADPDHQRRRRPSGPDTACGAPSDEVETDGRPRLTSLTSPTSSASTGPGSDSAPAPPPPSNGGWPGSPPAPDSPSPPSSTRPPRSPSTPTRSHPGCADKSSNVTTPAPSPGAATPDATTSTTSTPGDHPTKADHPEQTRTRNLGRLCRFHHRLKTNGDWTVERDPLTSDLTWTSPLGRRYLVTPSGTTPLDLALTPRARLASSGACGHPHDSAPRSARSCR